MISGCSCFFIYVPPIRPLLPDGGCPHTLSAALVALRFLAALLLPVVPGLLLGLLPAVLPVVLAAVHASRLLGWFARDSVSLFRKAIHRFMEKPLLCQNKQRRDFLVRVVGVEPTRLAAQEPKSCTSANSAIPAYMCPPQSSVCQAGTVLRLYQPSRKKSIGLSVCQCINIEYFSV